MKIPVISRQAIRGIILSDKDQVLLLRTVIPDTGRTIWIAPGGGIDPGERALECLSRELWEEVGYSDSIENATCIWRRQHTFLFNGTWFDQKEEYFLIRTPGFTELLNNNGDQIEIETVKECRWWKVSEIAQSNETFVPLRLGEHLERIVRGEVPELPVDVGE